MSAGGEWIPATCSRADLSILFGVSIRTIDNLIATGIIVPAEQRGMYQTLPSVVAYLEDLRNKAAGRSKDTALAEERAKTASIERQIAEIKLSQLRGAVLPLDEVADAWSAFGRSLKSAFLSVPAKLRARIPHMTAFDQETAREIITDTLTALAEEISVGVVGADAKDIEPDDA